MDKLVKSSPFQGGDYGFEPHCQYYGICGVMISMTHCRCVGQGLNPSYPARLKSKGLFS